MKYIISRSEKLFWLVLLSGGLILDHRIFIFLIIILVLRFRAGFVDTSSLGREMHKNFVYSPVNGVVSEIVKGSDSLIIKLKLIPVFGDLISSPGAFVIEQDPSSDDVLTFLIQRSESSIKLRLKNSVTGFSLQTHLKKGDELSLNSPMTEAFFGGELELLIPSSLSPRVRKGDFIWSGKTIICS